VSPKINLELKNIAAKGKYNILAEITKQKYAKAWTLRTTSCFDFFQGIKRYLEGVQNITRNDRNFFGIL